MTGTTDWPPPVAEFWRWDVLTLANLVIAPLLVVLGIGFRTRLQVAL